MRNYGKVHCTFWSSPTICSLSEDGRLLALYLITSSHNNIAGVFRLPDGYASEDLQWSSERLSKGFRELLANGFANRCEATKWVWVVKHLEWNEPENPNQRKAAFKIVAQIPDECGWKREFMRACWLPIGLEAPPTEKCSETVSKPFLNQEQEQELKQSQEQKKVQSHTQGPATIPPQLSGPVCVLSADGDEGQEAPPPVPPAFAEPLNAGQVAYHLQEAGMADARATSGLRALLDAGTTLDDLRALVPMALSKASPFDWLLSVAAAKTQQAAAGPAAMAPRAATAGPAMPAPPAPTAVRGGESATAYLAELDAVVAPLATPEGRAAADEARRNCVERSLRALTEAQLAAPVHSAAHAAPEL